MRSLQCLNKFRSIPVLGGILSLVAHCTWSYVPADYGILRWEKKELPKDIQEFPRILVGSIRGPFEGNFTYRVSPNDITVDLNSQADVQGNCWQEDTVAAIKERLNGQLAQAVIFERIPSPLCFSRYLRACILHGNGDNQLYQLPEPPTEQLKRYWNICSSGNRPSLFQHYKRGGHFYPINLPSMEVNLENRVGGSERDASPNSSLVYLSSDAEKDMSDADAAGGFATIDACVQLQAGAPQDADDILKSYFDLLAPGGKLVFMSTSGLKGRYGAIVRHHEQLLVLFTSNEDERFQCLYRDVFEQAGFEQISFFKDPCYSEDTICLEAYKPS